MVISLPAAFRNAFVQRTFLGLRFILHASMSKQTGHDRGTFILEVFMTSSDESQYVFDRRVQCTHFDVQNRKTLASLRTNADPTKPYEPP